MKKELAGILVLVLGVLSIPFAAAAENTTVETRYLTGISVASGSDAGAQLEEQGYTSFPQQMNLDTLADSVTVETVSGEASVLLGYQTGAQEDAITDLIVSTEKTEEKVDGDLHYELASEVSLNEGTDGTPLYLYYTKDVEAGSGIVDLSFYVSGQTEYQQSDAGKPILDNDGAEPVRMEDGSPANLEDGRADLELYVCMIRAELYLPYVSEIVAIDGSDDETVARQAVEHGCNYYTYVGNQAYGYERTADVSKAVCAEDGNAVLGLNPLGQAEGMTISQLAQLYFTKNTPAGAQIQYSNGYQSAIGDDTVCTVSQAEGIPVFTADKKLQKKLGEHLNAEEKKAVDVSGVLIPEDTSSGVEKNLQYYAALAGCLIMTGAAVVIFAIRWKKAGRKAEKGAAEHEEK